MAKTTTTIKLSSDEWSALKNDLEKELGFKSGDSINSITTRIHGKITNLSKSNIGSVSYLTTIWKKPKPRIGEAILNALAQILNYSDWEHYRTKKPQVFYAPIDINISKLEENQVFTLGWKDKYCILKYRGGFEFEVLKSVNMKSKVGRIFWTPGFTVDTSDSFEGPTIKLDDGEGNIGGEGYFQHHTEEYNDKPFDKEFYIVRFDDDYFYL